MTTNGQAGATPFDLIPRLTEQHDSAAIAVSANPFDIVPPISSSNSNSFSPGFTVAKKNTADTLRERINILRRFQFGAILAMLVWMTLLFIIFRVFIVKVWEAFLNENILNQLMRERSPGSSLSMLLFYLYFVYNTSLFLFLALSEMGIELHDFNIVGLLMIAGGVGGYLLLKHVEWAALSTIIPAQKELMTFSFSHTVFNVIIGLLLVPIILFIAYAPDVIKIYAIYTGAALFGLVYIFLSLRGLLMSGHYLVQNKIHFLLYLCAAEIAPVLLILKVIQNISEAS